MPKSLRIAVADDEPEVLDYFVQALARGGHRVVVAAEDGEELVLRCRAERPDLLITDIRMEGMTGIEAMQELAKDGPLPTILISAHHRQEDMEGQYVDQVAAFMPKPVKLSELLATVTQVAERLDLGAS